MILGVVPQRAIVARFGLSLQLRAGCYVICQPATLAPAGVLLSSWRGSKRHLLDKPHHEIEEQALLDKLAGMVEAGTLRPLSSTGAYPLAQTMTHRYVDSGRKQNNVIIDVAEGGGATTTRTNRAITGGTTRSANGL